MSGSSSQGRIEEVTKVDPRMDSGSTNSLTPFYVHLKCRSESAVDRAEANLSATRLGIDNSPHSSEKDQCQ